MTTHPVDSPNVTMGAAIPAYVRIRDTDPVRRDCHHADALVCRTDAVSETLLKSGWFKVQPDLIAPALQRALLSGACTDGMERSLDIEIEKLSDGSATLPSMTTLESDFKLLVDQADKNAQILVEDLEDALSVLPDGPLLGGVDILAAIAHVRAAAALLASPSVAELAAKEGVAAK